MGDRRGRLYDPFGAGSRVPAAVATLVLAFVPTRDAIESLALVSHGWRRRIQTDDALWAHHAQRDQKMEAGPFGAPNPDEPGVGFFLAALMYRFAHRPRFDHLWLTELSEPDDSLQQTPNSQERRKQRLAETLDETKPEMEMAHQPTGTAIDAATCPKVPKGIERQVPAPSKVGQGIGRGAHADRAAVSRIPSDRHDANDDKSNIGKDPVDRAPTRPPLSAAPPPLQKPEPGVRQFSPSDGTHERIDRTDEGTERMKDRITRREEPAPGREFGDDAGLTIASTRHGDSRARASNRMETERELKHGQEVKVRVREDGWWRRMPPLAYRERRLSAGAAGAWYGLYASYWGAWSSSERQSAPIMRSRGKVRRRAERCWNSMHLYARPVCDAIFVWLLLWQVVWLSDALDAPDSYARTNWFRVLFPTWIAGLMFLCCTLALVVLYARRRRAVGRFQGQFRRHQVLRDQATTFVGEFDFDLPLSEARGYLALSLFLFVDLLILVVALWAAIRWFDGPGFWAVLLLAVAPVLAMRVLPQEMMMAHGPILRFLRAGWLCAMPPLIINYLLPTDLFAWAAYAALIGPLTCFVQEARLEEAPPPDSCRPACRSLCDSICSACARCCGCCCCPQNEVNACDFWRRTFRVARRASLLVLYVSAITVFVNSLSGFLPWLWVLGPFSAAVATIVLSDAIKQLAAPSHNL